MSAENPVADVLHDIAQLSAEDRRQLLYQLERRPRLLDEAGYVLLPAEVYKAVMEAPKMFLNSAKRAVAKLPEMYAAGYNARNVKPRKDRRYQIIHELITTQEGFVTETGRPDWTKIKKQLGVIDSKLLIGGRNGKAVTPITLSSGYKRWLDRQP